MKYILGIVGLLSITSIALAAAKPLGIEFVSAVQNNNDNEVVSKYIDYDTKAVCYTVSRGTLIGGISCLKN